MTERTKLARHTTVEVGQRLLAIEPLIAGVNDDLLYVMRRAAAQPETRLIGVIDHTGVLVGVLPILRLAESIVARVAPESLMGSIVDADDVARFGHAVEARTVGDAMLPPAVIRPNSTLDEAFRRMHQRGLSGLYVVDDKGRPTGYLDLLELARRYVDAVTPESDTDTQSR